MLIKKNLVVSLILLLAGIFAAAGLGSEEIPDTYTPDNSHAEYSRALNGLNLAETPMGAEWLKLGTPANNHTPLTLLPQQEIRYFDPSLPDAAYYLIEGVRGQQISIRVEAPQDMGYFLDLFGTPNEFNPQSPDSPEWSEIEFTQLASGSHEAGTISDGVLNGAAEIQFEPRTSRFYLIRIQPRLLEGGSVTVTLESSASLSWPVQDSDVDDVISVFGDGRDGGTRVHHGIDIIAPKGTPLLAPTDVQVLRAAERDRGGKSVSLRDEQRGLMYYYAHLDNYADISSGDRLSSGAEIGGTGNTGNALGGPYHLHFGIYDRSWRRPLDPWYFLISPKNTIPEIPNPREAFNLQPGDRVDISKPLILYFQPPSQSALLQSPARRTDDGDALTPLQRPLQTVSWSGNFTVGPLYVSTLNEDYHAGVRIAAFRSNAIGLRFPDGRIGWLPLESNDGQLTALTAYVPEDQTGT